MRLGGFMTRQKLILLPALVLSALISASLLPAAAATVSHNWKKEWPVTDFAMHSVKLSEIMSGGPPKDGIPSIDAPRFYPASSITQLGPQEPVITFVMDGVARAYPLRVMIRHEIVNDVVGGVPVTVTYCPLCNTAIVFDRRVKGLVLDFGTTGKLRNADLVMYDRATESWWQQFTGEAIVGALTGTQLKIFPSRLESWEKFYARFPDGQVLVPRGTSLDDYGGNPYVKYDSSRRPFLFDGKLPRKIKAMARVVVVGNEAWALDLVRKQGRVDTGSFVITWSQGQNSALDAKEIARGKDVGNIVVQKMTKNGMQDIVHDVTFAFAFHAFHPEGVWHLK